MHKDDCIFCLIAQGKAPAHSIWEDEKHLAFLSIFPNIEGFTVVATKDHHNSYAFANDDQILAELVLATKKVAHILDTYFDDVTRCGMFFEGYGVDHLHSKLFPMHGAGEFGSGKAIEIAKPDIYFDTYPGYLSSHDSQRADDAKLAELTANIRKSSQG